MRRTLLINIGLVLLFALSAQAQIPHTFSLQGVLTDASGHSIADGTHQIRVTLYTQSSGGSGLYAEIQSATVKDGVFNLVVGSVTPFPGTLTFDRQYYAGISVDGAADLTPRLPVTAVPYALNAAHAEQAAALAPGATGVVTNVNGVDGDVTLVGGGSTTVTRSGQSILITSSGGGSTGIAGVQNTDGTIAVQNPNGPVATIGVATGGITSAQLADNAIIDSKLADGSVTEHKLAPMSVTGAKIARSTITLDKLSDAGAVAGQVPAYNGSAIVWTTPQAGGGLTLPYTKTINDPAAAIQITNNGGTVISALAPSSPTAIFASAGPANGAGVWGESTWSPGVYGLSESYNGVMGVSRSTQNAGVDGYSQNGIAVRGHTSTGTAVVATTGSGTGIDISSTTGVALKAISMAKTTAVVGTLEKTWLRNNVGVLGFAPSGEGVCGESETGIGVRGWSQSGNAFVGIARDGDAFYGTNNGNGHILYGKHTGAGHAVVIDQDGTGWGIMTTVESGIGIYCTSISGIGAKIASMSNVGVDAYSSSGDIIRGSQIQGISSDIRFRVLNNGNVRCDGAFTGGGADLAEAFDFEGRQVEYEPGDVLVISTDSDAKIMKSQDAYSHLVLGVYASKPGVILAHTEAEADLDEKIPVGVVGVIPTKVCAENGPIRRGDLLTTASIPGHAMKVHPVVTNGIPSFPSGIILGKALENFDGPGTGMIRVFVNTK